MNSEHISPEDVVLIILDTTPSNEGSRHPMVSACGVWSENMIDWIWNKERLAQFNVHDLVKIYRAAKWRDGDE